MPRSSKTIEDDESHRSGTEDEDWDEDDHSETPGGKELYRGRDHGGSDDDDDDDDHQDSGRKSRRSGSKRIPKMMRPPADSFAPGDVITVTVGKSDPRQDPGLKVEARNGKYYVRKVPSGGLFARTPVRAGDKILELNEVDSREFRKVNELKKLLKEEPRITVVVLRRDPDASDSSVSSFEEEEEEDDVDDIDDVSELTLMKKDAARSSRYNPVKKDSFSLRSKKQ